LFTRKHRTVQVTAAGRALALATGRAFAELLKACEPLAGAEARTRLRLSVSPLFASAWLIPRLPRFMADHPDIELVIESSLQVLDFDNEVVHAGVRVGDGNWPGLSALRLMDLFATPVAAPDLVERLNLRSAADLARAPMIHVSWFPRAWSEWLRQAGQADVQAKHTVWVDSFEAAVQLAGRGARTVAVVHRAGSSGAPQSSPAAALRDGRLLAGASPGRAGQQGAATVQALAGGRARRRLSAAHASRRQFLLCVSWSAVSSAVLNRERRP
jgi:DNA-binding transcriptional LysR family regulator